MILRITVKELMDNGIWKEFIRLRNGDGRPYKCDYYLLNEIEMKELGISIEFTKGKGY